MDSKAEFDLDEETEGSSVLSIGESLIETKKFSEAIQALSNWIHERGIKEGNTAGIDNHLISMVYNSRGHAKYLKVNFDGAYDDFNESLKYDANNSYAYYNRGTIAYRMGNFQTAEADMRRACELNSKSTEFQLALSRCSQQINLKLKG